MKQAEEREVERQDKQASRAAEDTGRNRTGQTGRREGDRTSE